ncbi:MAG: NADH-quinone oxidoreductase subunit NuoE [Proteobacteria bacterium]|nr:NADH-quinone oxidoreductase subunit NuoE [Pseudomonadota bacterium]
MSENSAKLLHQLVSAKRMAEIEHWVAKYPAEERQSAVMAVLRIVQEEHNHLTPDLMNSVAVYLQMPAIAVYEVASFYTMYEHKQVGRHVINVCTNISCMLCGSSKIVDYLEKKLAIRLGETTDDGQYTLRSVECLGACVNAPMMQVDKDYHENLTPEKIDKVLEKYDER